MMENSKLHACIDATYLQLTQCMCTFNNLFVYTMHKHPVGIKLYNVTVMSTYFCDGDG